MSKYRLWGINFSFFHLLVYFIEGEALRVAIVEIPSLKLNEVFKTKESKFAENIEKLNKLKIQHNRQKIDEFNLLGRTNFYCEFAILRSSASEMQKTNEEQERDCSLS